MKRAYLVPDERTLGEASRLGDELTCSKAVNPALEESVRRARAGRIFRLAGSGLWEGDLSAMRDDRPANPRVEHQANRVTG